jgi:hypothetical protein
LFELLRGKDAAGSQRVMEAIMQMYKPDIAAVKRAYVKNRIGMR